MDTRLGDFGHEWSEPAKLFNTLWNFADGFFDQDISLATFEKSSSNNQFKLLVKFFSPLNRHFYLLDDMELTNNKLSPELFSYFSKRSTRSNLGESALEWEILNTQKIAVVGLESKLMNEITYIKLQYRHLKNCFVTQEPVYNISLYWQFEEKGTKLMNDFGQLFESGIYPAFQRNEEYRNQLTRLIGTKLIKQSMNQSSFHIAVQAVKLTMSGSIQTIFVL